MLDSLRSLLTAHLALARAELTAIAREIGTLVGGLLLALLLALVGLVVLAALALVGLSTLLLGSPLYGLALLALLPLFVAALLATRALRIEGRRRPLALALFSGLSLGFALAAGLRTDLGTAFGWGLLVGVANATLLLASRLRAFESASLRERLSPRASIAELERTIDEASELIGGSR